MLPFLIASCDLSYAAAAAIVFAANMASCIVQPILGHAADRCSKPWLLSAGLMLAGLGLALTGIFQSYRWMLLSAILSGIGIAAYHPEAAQLVNFAAENHKGTAMSIFGFGRHPGICHRAALRDHSSASLGVERHACPNCSRNLHDFCHNDPVFTI